RDRTVTGVQTCALPILPPALRAPGCPAVRVVTARPGAATPGRAWTQETIDWRTLCQPPVWNRTRSPATGTPGRIPRGGIPPGVKDRKSVVEGTGGRRRA